MSQITPFVITISRQLGTGAAYIGQQLASTLGIVYLDREILQEAAKQLNVSEDIISSLDETVTPFWKSFIQSFANNSPDAMYMPPMLHMPNDHQVFEIESKIITQMANTQSAVVVGRGGVHVLGNYPRHLSIFLHASREFRLKRLGEKYQLNTKEACCTMNVSDNARARYHRLLSGKEWNDAEQYSLCLDTSALGIPASIELILAYVEKKFDVHV